jgi:hypothetical protein
LEKPTSWTETAITGSSDSEMSPSMRRSRPVASFARAWISPLYCSSGTSMGTTMIAASSSTTTIPRPMSSFFIL